MKDIHFDNSFIKKKKVLKFTKLLLGYAYNHYIIENRIRNDYCDYLVLIKKIK